jgi:hypothetical protein
MDSDTVARAELKNFRFGNGELALPSSPQKARGAIKFENRENEHLQIL